MLLMKKHLIVYGIRILGVNKFSMVTREEIINAVMLVAKKWPIQECYLFGSYSRGEETETSDVDLIIDLPDVISYLDLECMQNELSTLLNVPVDLKTLHSLYKNKRFYNHIKQDLKLLFLTKKG